jgi:hypothetical protein
MRKFYINAKRLRANGACESEVELFVDEFGTGKVLVNDENFERAVKAGLQIWWLAYQYIGTLAYEKLDGNDFGEDYEPQARRYWKAIKAKMAKDKAERPESWR